MVNMFCLVIIKIISNYHFSFIEVFIIKFEKNLHCQLYQKLI